MAPTNTKIDELRGRLKADPKNRLFYPLAEELRKVGQFTESEQVLRTGLQHHPTYLSAWVSLGRVFKDLGKNHEAVEALAKALQLDPGNVVAARLLGDAYLALGEKVEAIKKYKLVHALMPSDEQLEEQIARLDQEINPPPPVPVAAPEQEPEPQPEAVAEADPFAAEEPAAAEDDSPFADDSRLIAQAAESFAARQDEAAATADDEPMRAAHMESPFEEPAADFSADAVELEAPAGMHVEEMPLAAEVAAPWIDDVPEPEAAAEPAGDVFAPAGAAPFAAADDVAETVTMADLYARQGSVEQAREIYEHLLQRDPGNHSLRAKLDALPLAAAAIAAVPEPELLPDDDSPFGAETAAEEAPLAPVAAFPSAPAPAPTRDPRVERLEAWLAKVGRKEVSHV
jgi:tetratricopeptide (TPR) repeat protein